MRAALTLLALAAAAPRAQASPLRDRILDLACGNAEVRRQAIATLERAPRGPLGLPDESLAQPAVEVHAYVIDRLLEVLGAARARDPEIAPRIDALVASWNYCAVTAQERVWDVRYDGDRAHRAQDAIPFASAGRGFGAWGLLPRRAAGRPQPPPAADPDGACDAALPSVIPAGSLAARVEIEADDPTCEGPPVQRVAAVAAAAPASPSLTAAAPARAPTVARPAAAIGAVLDASAAAPPLAVGLSATGFARQALAGGAQSGVLASWSPRAAVFVRASAAWRITDANGMATDARPTYAWGIGYDDWHPGTVSVALNQWGPVAPSDGWRIARTAVAEVAYKLPLGAASQHLGLRVSASSPLTWAPALGAAATLKLPRSLFATVAVAQALRFAQGPTWTYVVGRSTWAPRALSIIFANYGPNRIPTLNFRRNGAVTASWGVGVVTAVSPRRLVAVIDAPGDARDRLVELLDSVGYRVVAADDEPRACESLGPEAPALILVGGPAAMAGLRRRAPLADVPVVVISATAADADIEAAFDAGASDYIVTPLDRRIFVARIDSVIRAAADRRRASASKRLVARRDHLRSDLEEASRVQRSLNTGLPRCFGGGTIMGASVPCRHVGGDVTAVFETPGGVQTAVLVDVSGHGTGAALIASAVLAELRALANRFPIAEALAELNTQMIASGSELFACVGAIQLDGSRLTIVNAGLPPVALLRGGAIALGVQGAGIPPGMLPGSQYEQVDLVVRDGDRLVMVSDGLTEPFGEATDLGPCLAALDLLVPNGVRTAVAFAEAIHRRFDYRPLEDDATVLVVDCWDGDAAR